MPCLIMGSILGRLYGEFVRHFIEIQHIGGYAVVGAAAMTACVTRTTSVSVIILELSGQLNYLPSILLAVLIAYGVGQYFTNSFTDMILQQKRMPYLPLLLKQEIYHKKVREVKQQASDYLTGDSNLIDMLEILYKDEINKRS